MKVPQIYMINNQEIEVYISDFGLIIQKMLVKNPDGIFTDVVLGFDSINDYLQPDYLDNYPYFGAVMGRCANRIGGASFQLNGKNYCLAKNAGNDHLHGGKEGFDRKMWTLEHHEREHLTFSYISRDGEEGYPGNLTTIVDFSLQECSLCIHYFATCDQDCFVNLTHHPYFNFCPAEETVKHHQLKVFSDTQLETSNLIPTGKIIKCAEPFLFTSPKSLQDVIEHHGGLDHTYIFADDQEMKTMGLLSHPDSKWQLEIVSNYASMQVYTGAFLNVKNGKGRDYPAFSGIAFEPQMYPDAPHHAHFPSTLLTPKMHYDKTILFRFF